MSIPTKSRLLFWLFCCLLNLGVYSASATPLKKSLLVLFPYQHDLPNHEIALQSLREEFDSANDLELDLYYEYMELIRFPDPVYQEHLFDLLEVKYRNKQIDLVLINSRVLLDQWLEKRGTILPDTPVVFYSASTASIEGLQFPPDVTGVTGKVDFGQSIKWILRVRPSVNEIVLVYGKGQMEHSWIQPVDFLRKEAGEQVQLRDLSGLSVDEIKQQVATLQPNSIVLYELMFKDAAGDKYRPIDILQELAIISSVPVLSGYDQFIGTGTIGGYMYSTEQQARDAAKIALRILRGEAVSSIPIRKDTSNRFIFDHLALQRFDISLANVPPESIIKNRQYSLWEEHQMEVMTALSACAVLVFFVIFLLGLSRNLYHARLALTHLNSNLETKVKERTAELQQANDTLKCLSNTDALTGLMNRRAIQSAIDTEMARKKRFNHAVSFLILDLDHFKQINDQYGHAAGDDVLAGVAGTVKAVIRSTDSLARWGGEEFVVLAANTPIRQAVVLAQKICKTVESVHFENIGTVTVSIGIAEYHGEENFQQWYERADSALYRAKAEGRNRAMADQHAPKQEFSAMGILKMAWTDDFCSGHPVLDKQHVELFDQANRFIDAVLTGADKRTVDTLLENLLISFNDHFVYEEQILEQSKYPKLESHSDSHRKLRSELDQLVADFREDVADPFIFIQFISQEFISRHIVTVDQDYFKWLTSHNAQAFQDAGQAAQ